MFTLGIPNRQYRRATQVLGPESADPINYDVVKQDDGFYLFSFPEIDEYDFRDIVLLLKNNGITTIGADTELTERKIMKLTDLLKEQGSPDENDIIDSLKKALKDWKEDKVAPYDRLDRCERSDQYFLDIEQIVENYEEEIYMDTPAPSDLSDLQERKLKRFIKKIIKQ